MAKIDLKQNKKISGFSRTTRDDPLTGGETVTYAHPSGFKLIFFPKPKFSRKFASITVPFGSLHNRTETRNGILQLPPGSAHYMEHCIFGKDENGGLLGKLSSLGASANAYTSHTHTMYYFSAADNFFQSLELYFDSVVNPYLGVDRVDSERDIILQELSMYEDDPDSMIIRDTMESLYLEHPVRLDIGGTKESVSKISFNDLEKIRETFYSPGCITLAVAGDMPEEKLLEFIEGKYLSSSPVTDKTPVFPPEPEGISAATGDREMDVDVQSFMIGIKNPAISPQKPISPKEAAAVQKGGDLLADILLGSSSDIFEELYSEGLINDSFRFGFTCEETYSYFLAGGESEDPRKASEKLYSMLVQQISEFNVADRQKSFETRKRSSIGNFIRSLDSVESCGMAGAVGSLYGIHVFDLPRIYADLDLHKALGSMEFLTDTNFLRKSYIIRER